MTTTPAWLTERLAGFDDGCAAVVVSTVAGAPSVAPTFEVASAGPVDTVHPVASVTKALFSYALMIAVEEGSVSLDEPCGVFGSTVRHVLSHAGGLGFAATDPTTPDLIAV